MAMKVSATVMITSGGEDPGLLDANQELFHGGDLGAARRLFPGAPEPFIDLSTGINPYPYPVPRLAADQFARLPAPADVQALVRAAARAYGAAFETQDLAEAHVVPVPGTQIVLPIVARLVPPGRAAVLTPGYAEHGRAARLAGHKVEAVSRLDDCGDARLVIVANPNNPDGRLFARSDLLALAADLRRRGGLLVIDEAFMDVAPPGSSLAPDIAGGDIVVLRSFGKFFGLAGLRLGFALGAPPLARKIAAALGPWAVSGPAIAVGTQALADTPWIERTRARLDKSTQRLDAMLADLALPLVGGTSLFRLVQTPAANALFQHLGEAGIWVRAFAENPKWLRFGLPGNEAAWRRLKAALVAFW
jgi:cobalamin biosynthetic protein CobC